MKKAPDQDLLRVVPPHSIEAERSVLGALLVDPRTIDPISEFLIADDFYKQSHAEIYRAILALHERGELGERPDVVLVLHELRRRGTEDVVGGAVTLSEISDSVPSAQNVLHYAKLVKKHAARRELIKQSAITQREALEQDREPEVLLESARRRLENVPTLELEQDVDEPIITCMANVARESVTWLWKPYLPEKSFCLLTGDPQAGKTYVALAIAAALSTGGALPGAEPRPPARVLYLTAEDSLSKTISRRLDQAKADSSMVYVLEGRRTVKKGRERKTRNFTLADPLLASAIARVKPALVVIDPIQGYLGDGVDMHRANEVRPILTGLVHLAEQHNCVILGIRHMAKGASSRVMYRGLGSIDFTACCRSELIAGIDPRSKERAIVQVKSSLGKAGPAIGYEVSDEHGLVWKHTTLTAADLVASEGQDEESSVDPDSFLREELAQGPRPVKELMARARELGITTWGLRAARLELGVQVERVNQGARGGGYWAWRLSTAMTIVRGPKGPSLNLPYLDDNEEE